ncbi:hypothetical protein [Luteococcus peritonei]|uniref:Glycosyltransferase n=1 Tax=Luteococcus peritonei TaxID=88874 RepID=A0ABW4RZ38_9ACTN
MTTAPTRLAIGPANYAGQAHAWAKAVERHLDVPADSFNRGPLRRHDFRFETDREIPAPLFFAPLLRRARLKGFLRRYSHVALDGFTTFFQTPARRDVAADALFLRENGFQVALVAHGSDLRDPAEHIRRNRWSYFNEGDEAYRAHHAELARRAQEAVRRTGLPCFVSTPDLLHDLPQATWLPVCIDPASAVVGDEPLRRRVPRVLHMPSRRVPPIKGSQYVEPVLQRLEQEGLVEFVSPSRVPHAEVPALLAGVDIVVDQLLAASYGVTAVEAMAAGRVTVAAVSEATVELMPQRPPLVDADPDTFEQVMRDVLERRDEARELAAQGPGFVAAWHDGGASARRLQPWLRPAG